MLHFQDLLYILEIIFTELISQNYNNSLIGHFGIKKIRELVAWKYYWLTFYYNVKAYVKGCDVCLASKVVKHKSYRDL